MKSVSVQAAALTNANAYHKSLAYEGVVTHHEHLDFQADLSDPSAFPRLLGSKAKFAREVKNVPVACNPREQIKFADESEYPTHLGRTAHLIPDERKSMPHVGGPEGEVSFQATHQSEMILAVKRCLESMHSLNWPRMDLDMSFQAKREPCISFSDYFDRFVELCRCSPHCWIMALVYIRRAMMNSPGLPFNKLTCHRLFAASAVVAIKFHDEDDEIYRDHHYAKVAGISVKDLSQFQLEFLQLIDWKLKVDPEEVDLIMSTIM